MRAHARAHVASRLGGSIAEAIRRTVGARAARPRAHLTSEWIGVHAREAGAAVARRAVRGASLAQVFGTGSGVRLGAARPSGRGSSTGVRAARRGRVARSAAPGRRTALTAIAACGGEKSHDGDNRCGASRSSNFVNAIQHPAIVTTSVDPVGPVLPRPWHSPVSARASLQLPDSTRHLLRSPKTGVPCSARRSSNGFP